MPAHLQTGSRPDVEVTGAYVEGLLQKGTLNETDWEVVWALYQHRFLTTLQCHRLLFVGKVKEPMTRNRLRKLWKLRVLDRIGLDRAHMQADGLAWEHTYMLGEGGKRWLKTTLKAEGENDDTRFLPTLDNAIGHPLLFHDLCLNEFSIRMVEEARRRGQTPVYRSERETTEVFREGGQEAGKVRLFRPDGALEITRADGQSNMFYIENDMGGREHRRTTKKVRMYERYYHSGAWKTLFPRFPIVLVVTSTEARKDNLMASMAKVRHEVEMRWLFASREMINRSGVVGPIWSEIDRAGARKEASIFNVNFDYSAASAAAAAVMPSA